MRLPSLPQATGEALHQAGRFVSNLLTPTLRLGVTGLSRAGKTVFITALVRNLVAGGRLPFFTPQAAGRFVSAHLQPQPDDQVPRFDYEAHLAALGGVPPEWPESTRQISELRVAVSFRPESVLRRSLGIRSLNIDVVDYPGEWLIDLGMLDQGYAAWSADAMDLARDRRHRQAARDWLAFQDRLDPYAAEDESEAREGAALFTAYLQATRTSGTALPTLGPGRFLMPGDLAGSPLLTFFPLELRGLPQSPRGSLAAMMARRYESYRAHVVRPFFRDHFSRLDRQIVLVDVLAALNSGPDAVTDLQIALESVLQAFRPGANSWLSMITGRRIDRLLFAATKADHLHHTSHDRLESILRLMTDRAIARASDAGADVRVMALAALRATREAEAKHGKERLPCIVGTPLPRERIDGKVFDGRKEAAIFPGDLPDDPALALDGSGAYARAPQAAFVRFRPPRVPGPSETGGLDCLPHIRLDRALDFLIGDWLS